jgi:hypothetical protein
MAMASLADEEILTIFRDSEATIGELSYSIAINEIRINEHGTNMTYWDRGE